MRRQNAPKNDTMADITRKVEIDKQSQWKAEYFFNEFIFHSFAVKTTKTFSSFYQFSFLKLFVFFNFYLKIAFPVARRRDLNCVNC